MQHQHTVECEFIASGLDPLPDAMRAEWAGAFGQWLAQYRRGVVEPIPRPAIQAPTPPAAVAVDLDEVEPEAWEDDDFEDLSDEDAAEIAAIAEEINETDRAILKRLDRFIEPVNAGKVAETLPLSDGAVRNRMVDRHPLKKFALVTSDGGYLITERGRRVLRPAGQVKQH